VGREAAADRFGSQEVVGIEEDDKARARLPQSCVPGGAQTGVGLLQEPHAGVAGDHARRIVLRTVVDDDDLVERPGLGEGAAKLLVVEVWLVIGVHDVRYAL
jgi:hypothetical protein